MKNTSLEFLKINPGNVFLGRDNGGLYFAAERPRHKVEINYNFEITKDCITEDEWNDVFNKNEIIPNYNKFNQQNIEDFLKNLNERNEDYRFRLPSESEWELAKKQLEGSIVMPNEFGELIADQPHVSYWGAPCDGSPWFENNPKSAGFGMQCTKSGSSSKDKSITPGFSLHKSHKKNIKFRIVRIPRKHIDAFGKKLPSEFDRFEIFKREMIISIFVGIIPSFIWAYFNASPGYIVSGFGNLIMGGVFFSLFTGLIYRPKHSTLEFTNNKIISISPYRKKIRTLISFEDGHP
jgi:hypothetical protein|tara:strand:+ start:6511 stop:7389 length:879 start_codon:yes stop_codon:yes gene_type:complete